MISDISETGLVLVNFTYAVPIRDNLHNTLIAGMIECSYINKAEGFKKKGVPQQIENLDFSSFLSYRNKIKFGQDESDGRRLALLTKDEYDSRVDYEKEAKKSDFNWTITSFTNEYMTVQLKFTEPNFISTYDFDQLEFSFNRTYYDQVLKAFNRTDLIEIEYNYTI